MKQFCRECGKSASPSANVCIHCGTPLKVEAASTETTSSPVSSEKRAMSRKKKLIWQIVAGVAVFLIGFSVWANSYQSPESVQKRFDRAVSDGDSGKLKKLMVHEDGSSISEQEAKAFLKLVKQEGKNHLFDLYYTASHGKFLGIFKAHKIEVVDQYATYDDLIDGLSFEFNGKKIAEYAQDEESIVYGPLAPGVYTVKALFEGEYGETMMEDSLTLDNPYREYTAITMDIPVSKVVFYVDNYDQLDPSKSHIELNDEKISISKEGETKEIGPFILDGSQKVKTVVEMPWGKVVSEDFSVDDPYMVINADLISLEQYKELTGVLKDFGEQFVQAMAKESTKPFKVVSSDLKKELAKPFNDNYYYSGKFEKVRIDKDSMRVDRESKTPEIQIDVAYEFKEDHHDLTEKADLSVEELFWNIGLSFNKEDKKWTLTSLEQSGMWGGFEATDEIKGSQKLYGPSKEAISKAETGEIEAEIEEFIKEYTQASVDAINYRDFDLMDKYITKDGPRRKEARDYIDYLDSKDIYEDWYGSELEKVESVDDSTWKVTVIEEFEIYRPDSSEVKKFRTSLIIKRIDNQYYVNELTETNGI